MNQNPTQGELLLKLQELDTEIRNLSKENSGKHKGKLAALTKERQTKARNIDKDLLDKYEHLKNTKENGVAVVFISNGVCGGCHLMVPLTKLQKLRIADQVQFCEYCGRILVYRG